MKSYKTIINGGDNKYKVNVQKTKIIIIDLDNDKEIEIKNYKNIFIGKNSKKYGIYDKSFTGSSILVQIKDLEYIYICSEIKRFKTKEPINKYYSIMGNNYVVYPFALSENYVYLLAENVYLYRDFGNKDPYEVYYDFKKIWKRKSYKFISK
jgi:hypothetical protein